MNEIRSWISISNLGSVISKMENHLLLRNGIRKSGLDCCCCCFCSTHTQQQHGAAAAAVIIITTTRRYQSNHISINRTPFISIWISIGSTLFLLIISFIQSILNSQYFSHKFIFGYRNIFRHV